MKTSPIKLKSKSKPKLSSSRSHQTFEKQEKGRNQRESSPIHTLGPKVSPNKHKRILSNLTTNNVPQLNNSVGLKIGQSSNKMAPIENLERSLNLKNCNSLHQLMENSISQIPKSSERSKVNVDMNRKVIAKNEILMPTQRVVSPSKIVAHPSQKQVELERKVRILEMRINELYSEKNKNQTQLNQTNIRLQCENNILKTKLNTLAQKPQTKRDQPKQCTSCQMVEQNCEQISRKLIMELEKSQGHVSNQSKEIHSLKQQLSETQELLSQQINKSLNLLEEVKNKENQNDQLKIDIKNLVQQNSRLHETIEAMQEQIQSLREQTNKYNLQASRDRNEGIQITKQLMNDLQQNNNLLLTAIRQLEVSLQQSHQQVSQLTDEKDELQHKLFEIQQAHKSWIQKDSYTLEQIEALSQKISEIQNELNEKNNQLGEKDNLIKNQELKIQELTRVQHDHEGKSSTAGSFYQKNSCDPCDACDELRKTVLKLNTYLNKK